ncbi:MAG: hypothetical protein BJ554DRAFT_5746, partial [Olpidium bornovanus]
MLASSADSKPSAPASRPPAAGAAAAALPRTSTASARASSGIAAPASRTRNNSVGTVPAAAAAAAKTTAAKTTAARVAAVARTAAAARVAAAARTAAAPSGGPVARKTSVSLSRKPSTPPAAPAAARATTAARAPTAAVSKPAARSAALARPAPTSSSGAPSATSAKVFAKAPAVNGTSFAARSSKEASPPRSADPSLEKLVAELKQQGALFAAGEAPPGADPSAGAEAAELRSQVSELHVTVESLRAQLARSREENAAVENHVDELNAKIIAISDKHHGEVAELHAAVERCKSFEGECAGLAAEVAALRSERDALTTRVDELEGISEALDHAHMEKEKMEEALESVSKQFAELSASRNDAQEHEGEAFREAEKTVEQLKVQVAEMSASRTNGQTEDLASEVQELRRLNAALTEDLRLREQEIAAAEELTRSQMQDLDNTRVAAESAADALRAEVAGLRSELEHAKKAVQAGDEAAAVHSKASLLVDEGARPSAVDPRDGDVSQDLRSTEEVTLMLRKTDEELESVRAEKAALQSQLEQLSVRLVDAEEHGKLAAEAAAAAGHEANETKALIESLRVENAAIAAENSALKEEASRRPSTAHADGESTGSLQSQQPTDRDAELDRLEARVAELTAALERQTEVGAQIQVSVPLPPAALAVAEEAHASEARRAEEIEERLKLKEEEVKVSTAFPRASVYDGRDGSTRTVSAVEGAMANMKPPKPPLAISDTERFLKRELECKDSMILELQKRCDEAERICMEEIGRREGAADHANYGPAAVDEESLRKELEKKDAAIAKLQLKVERVMRVHAEDVHSVQTRSRHDIADEQQRSKDALVAAQKENDILVKLVMRNFLSQFEQYANYARLEPSARVV